MKILIPGVAGFIGFHLASRLIEAGHNVVGVDYPSSEIADRRISELKERTRAHLVKNAKCSGVPHIEAVNQFQVEDIGQSEPCELWGLNLTDGNLPIVGKVNLVIHLAAATGVRRSIDYPEEYVAANLDGFTEVLEYCRTYGTRLIYASSSSVYGERSGKAFRETDQTDNPQSFYAATKKANEVMAQSYSNLFGLDITGLRFFTVYGPWGRPDMAYHAFTDAMVDGQAISVYGNGESMRDYTYIDDVVDAITAMIPKPHGDWHRVFNVGGGNPVQLNDFIYTLEGVTGIEAKRNHIGMQDGDVGMTLADPSKLKDYIGFIPQTPLKKGLTKFWEWYREYYGVEDAQV